MKELVAIKNNGRRITKDGPYGARMRLKRNDSDRKNRKIKVTFTSESNENFGLIIGVVSPRYWDKYIVYNRDLYEGVGYHYSGYILDNNKYVKQVKEVKTTLYIEDTLFMIVNNNKHIRELTFKNNEQTIFKTFYMCNVLEEKVPYLVLLHPVTIEVETGKVAFAYYFDIDFKSNGPSNYFICKRNATLLF